MLNCPSCEHKLKVDDYVSCQNKSCLEYNQKYLPYEWNQLIKDLNELKRLEL